MITVSRTTPLSATGTSCRKRLREEVGQKVQDYVVQVLDDIDNSTVSNTTVDVEVRDKRHKTVKLTLVAAVVDDTTFTSPPAAAAISAVAGVDEKSEVKVVEPPVVSDVAPVALVVPGVVSLSSSSSSPSIVPTETKRTVVQEEEKKSVTDASVMQAQPSAGVMQPADAKDSKVIELPHHLREVGWQVEVHLSVEMERGVLFLMFGATVMSYIQGADKSHCLLKPSIEFANTFSYSPPAGEAERTSAWSSCPFEYTKEGCAGIQGQGLVKHPKSKECAAFMIEDARYIAKYMTSTRSQLLFTIDAKGQWTVVIHNTQAKWTCYKVKPKFVYHWRYEPTLELSKVNMDSYMPFGWHVREGRPDSYEQQALQEASSDDDEECESD